MNLAIIGNRGHLGMVLRQMADLPDIRLVAACPGGCDEPLTPIETFAREHHHNVSVFDDVAKMLDEAHPDISVVCGPFELHAQHCIAAIARGIHVLTEKPAALTIEELQLLREALRQRPEVHLAGLMASRYEPGFFTAHELIASGAIGTVRLLNARKSYKLGKRAKYYHDRRTYGGTIPWVGSHAIDWVMWLAGGRFDSVFATHSADHNGNNGTMERSAQCLFTLDDGRSATVSIDVFRPENAPSHGDDWIRIVGTEGVLEARPHSLVLINAANDGSQPVTVKSETNLLKDFLSHLEGRPSQLNAQSTLALTEACLLARQSADENRLVTFQK